MPKNKISEYSATANSNTDIGGINVDEGCAPSGINDAIRTMMAQLKNFQTGTGSDSFNGPVGSTTASTGAFTTLSASSTVSGTGFSTYLASPPAIGGTAAAAGTFTTLSGSTSVTTPIVKSATSLVLQTNGTTTALTLDTAQNMGLGVTPSAWGNNFAAIQLKGLFGGGLSTSSASNTSTNLSHNAYNNGTNWVYGATGFGAARYEIEGPAGGATYKWYNAPSGTAGNAITFTQAMSLLASGAWVLGDTSTVASGFAGVKFNGASFNGLGLNDSSATTGAGYIYFQSNGTTIGSITRVGATSAVAYNSTSDQRLKENIVDAPEFGSVIDSIKVRSYNWKIDGSHQRSGFIAQELVTVAPEAVYQPANSDDMMAVDYSKLVPMLVKEIQSLRQRLAAIESN